MSLPLITIALLIAGGALACISIVMADRTMKRDDKRALWWWNYGNELFAGMGTLLVLVACILAIYLHLTTGHP